MTIFSLKLVVFIAIVGIIGYGINNYGQDTIFGMIFSTPKVPRMNKLFFWGEQFKNDQYIYPYSINISTEVIEDLKLRLKNSRAFTPPLENVEHQYGFNTDLLKEILEFWKNEYNWEERQAYLNQYPQYSTYIQGIHIRYIHVKPTGVPQGTKVLPLLLLHGWPGSVREFYDIIPLLTTPSKDRDFVFEVVVPHLPGFGFSDAPIRRNMGLVEISQILVNFMARVGHGKFYVQGGDLGAMIAHHMAAIFPYSLSGLHSNMCFVVSSPLAFFKTFIKKFTPAWLVGDDSSNIQNHTLENIDWLLQESGYFHIQATKPDTLGVALSDSPIGLAAYHLEKFIVGTNRENINKKNGGLLEKYTYTQLLDNIMIYWLGGSVTSSFRVYADSFNKRPLSSFTASKFPVTIPSACARFKHDLNSRNEAISDIYQNLVQLNDYEGGHFAALENPELLANDIFQAVEKMEKVNDEAARANAEKRKNRGKK